MFRGSDGTVGGGSGGGSREAVYRYATCRRNASIGKSDYSVNRYNFMKCQCIGRLMSVRCNVIHAWIRVVVEGTGRLKHPFTVIT